MKSKNMTKEQWIKLFKSAGISRDTMNDWHGNFEKQCPAGHQEFLEWLGIPAVEISRIRQEATKA
jgi:hypothetical protein